MLEDYKMLIFFIIASDCFCLFYDKALSYCQSNVFNGVKVIKMVFLIVETPGSEGNIELLALS